MGGVRPQRRLRLGRLSGRLSGARRARRPRARRASCTSSRAWAICCCASASSATRSLAGRSRTGRCAATWRGKARASPSSAISWRGISTRITRIGRASACARRLTTDQYARCALQSEHLCGAASRHDLRPGACLRRTRRDRSSKERRWSALALARRSQGGAHDKGTHPRRSARHHLRRLCRGLAQDDLGRDGARSRLSSW